MAVGDGGTMKHRRSSFGSGSSTDQGDESGVANTPLYLGGGGLGFACAPRHPRTRRPTAKGILATSLAIVSEAIVMAASRSAVTGGRYYDQPNRDQLDLDALVGRIGWDSGLGVSGRGGRSTSADQATRTGRDTGLELVSRQDGSKPGDRANGTGWDTGLELVGRHRSTPGDRANRTGQDTGLELVGRQDRSTPGDRATRTGQDTGLELVRRQDRSTPGDRATRTGQDTGLELVRRQDRSTPGDRATRTGQDTGLELVRRQDRSTPGDRRDTAPEVVRTPVANRNRDRRSAKQVGRLSAVRHTPWEPHAGRGRTAETRPPGVGALRHCTEEVPLALE